MADDASTLRLAITRLQQTVRQLATLVERHTTQIGAVAALADQSERFAADLSPLAAGITTLDIAWPHPFPDTGYGVYLTPIVPAVNLGQVFATYGAKSPTGCTLVIRNTSGGAISAGINALAIRT